jgi:hypothetical protein
VIGAIAVDSRYPLNDQSTANRSHTTWYATWQCLSTRRSCSLANQGQYQSLLRLWMLFQALANSAQTRCCGVVEGDGLVEVGEDCFRMCEALLQRVAALQLFIVCQPCCQTVVFCGLRILQIQMGAAWRHTPPHAGRTLGE